MLFFSKPASLRVQLSPGGYLPDPLNPQLHNPVGGEKVQFVAGQFDSATYHGKFTEEELIEKLRAHQNYGYPRSGRIVNGRPSECIFWCELDRPESERMEERMRRLEAENEALRKAMDAKVVYVDKPAEARDAEPTISDLRAKCKELGIKTERDWKLQDYKDAIYVKRMGHIEHDGWEGGGPVKIGGKASAAAPSGVSEN